MKKIINHNAAAALQALAISMGMELDDSSQAISLQEKNGNQWFIEASEDGKKFIIHTAVDALPAPTSMTASDLLTLLTLNTQLDFMGGTWLGIHDSPNTLRLLTTLSADLANLSEIGHHIEQIAFVKNKILEFITTQDITQNSTHFHIK